MTYLAYVQARPHTEDASGIFYVGKGTNARSRDVSARNPHHGNVVAKYGAKNILIGRLECSSEQTAFELERGLIKCLRRMGVALTNQTDGGEGTAGYTHTEDARERISKGIREKLEDPEFLPARSSAIREALSDPEVHARRTASIAETWKSEALRAAHSQIITDTWKRPDVCEKQRVARLKSWEDPDTRKRRSAATAAGKSKPEAREAVSVTMKQVYQDPAMRQQASARTKGKIWVNDGVKSLRVLPESIPDGFVCGRLPFKPKKPHFN